MQLSRCECFFRRWLDCSDLQLENKIKFSQMSGEAIEFPHRSNSVAHLFRREESSQRYQSTVLRYQFYEFPCKSNDSCLIEQLSWIELCIGVAR